MLYGHFAVSGDQEESAICCLCGYIAEADDWDRFDHEWTARAPNSSGGVDATDCLYGTGFFQSWDLLRRNVLLAELSAVLAGSALVPMGALVIREHFSGLSSSDRALLAAEGIESPLDLIFYDLMERIIRRVHDESEKISLLFEQKPKSATERYNELFNKHLGRYLLGPHLMGALSFADARGCSYLQAAKLLSEAVLLVETQRAFPEKVRAAFPFSALQQLAEPIRGQGRFGAAELHKLAASLKSIKSK